MPIASYVEMENENETFSTLSATMLGAGEVIFSGFKKEKPNIIVGYSEDSVLFIKGIDTNMTLSLLGNSDKEKELETYMQELASKIEKLSETFKVGGS